MCLDWSDLGLIPNSICSFAASESFDVGETYLTMKNPNLSRGCLKHSTCACALQIKGEYV